jgi:hypothetical protein
MMKLRTFVFVALATVVLAVCSSGIPIPMLDLRALGDASDAILVGEVLDVWRIDRGVMAIRDHSMSVDTMEARFRVDRVIKGDAGHEIRFRFLLPEFGMGYHGVAQNSYRLVFLKQTAESTTFTSPYYPSFPATASHVSESGATFDKVVSEIAAALEAASTSDNDRQVAIWTLRTVSTSTATRALRFAARNSNSSRVTLTAVAALLARGDISEISLAEQVLTQAEAPQEDELRQNLLAAIYEGVNTEQAIPTLRHLLGSSDVKVRRVVVMAMRNTKSISVFPDLSRALNDSDFEVRYYAVVGLAEITGQNEWRPLMDRFRSDEERYLTYWRTWARVHNY